MSVRLYARFFEQIPTDLATEDDGERRVGFNSFLLAEVQPPTPLADSERLLQLPSTGLEVDLIEVGLSDDGDSV